MEGQPRRGGCVRRRRRGFRGRGPRRGSRQRPAVGVGTADEYGAGTEADALRCHCAADSAIHQDFCAAVDGGDDFGERPNCGIDGIELAAAVVRDDDGGDAFVNGAARVVSCKQPFTMIGPGQTFLIHSNRSTLRRRLRGRRDVHQLHGASPGTVMFSSLGIPPSARNAASQRGCARNCGKKGSLAKSELPRSCFMPLRGSRSRIPATGVSTVMTSAEKPARRARSMPLSAAARPPRR